MGAVNPDSLDGTVSVRFSFPVGGSWNVDCRSPLPGIMFVVPKRIAINLKALVLAGRFQVVDRRNSFKFQLSSARAACRGAVYPGIFRVLEDHTWSAEVPLDGNPAPQRRDGFR